jgi:hypothetical protein
MKLVRALAVTTVVVALAGCSAVPHPAPRPMPTLAAAMTMKDAKARYLAIVSPLNKAIDNENAAGDDSWQEFVYYAASTRDAYKNAAAQARAVGHWPLGVRASMITFEQQLGLSAKVMDAVSHSASDDAVRKALGPNETVVLPLDDTASLIRRELGLPESAGGL